MRTSKKQSSTASKPRSKVRRRIAPFVIASPFGLRSAGWERLPPGYGCDAESKAVDYTSLNEVVSGRLHVIAAHKNHIVHPEELILIPAGTPRNLYVKGEPVHYHVVTFVGPIAAMLSAGFKLPLNTPFKCKRSLRDYFKKFIQDIKKPGLTGERAGALHLFEMFAFMAHHIQPHILCPAAKHIKDLVASAMREIQTHWHENTFGVAQLAESLKVDNKTLYTHFIQETGLSPKQYIDHMRLQHIMTMLQTDQPIEAIARSTGFRSPEYLTNFFRRKMGISPSSYRIRSNMSD